MSAEAAIQNLDRPSWQIRLAAVGLTVLTLASCSSREPTSPAESPTAAAPSLSPESLAPKDCSYRYVQPGLNLSQENASDLEEDLSRMAKLYQGTDEVGLGDIAGVGRVIKDSYQDPLYVQAISQARESIAGGQKLTAEQLLALPVESPASCDANHIEKSASENQIKQTVSLSQSLTRKLGERLGDRASILTKKAYNTLEKQLEELRRKAEETEQQPPK